MKAVVRGVSPLGPDRDGGESAPAGRMSGGEALEAAREGVRANLLRLAESLPSLGLPRPALDGKILRPLTAYLTVPEALREHLDDRFWWGALAVEMVHEASLLHDDILDEAPERRGKPTVAAAAGIGPALVMGDHLLTAAYRAAASADSPEFLQVFIQAVERTVAGEIAQERAEGRILEADEYRRIITGKSGELFRAVFSLAPCLLDVGSPEAVGTLGARLGCLYQMVDDFLDYCPDADRGKVPLQDYRQEKWTWPLGLIEVAAFDGSEADILPRLFRRPVGGGPSPMETGVTRMEDEVDDLLAELREQGLEIRTLETLLQNWLRLLRGATHEEMARFSSTTVEPAAATPLPHPREAGGWPVEEGVPSRAGSEDRPVGARSLASEHHGLVRAAASLGDSPAWLDYFGRHARTFRFASYLFPPSALEKVAGVYAFCRFTDDLVDEATESDPDLLDTRLDSWLELARAAYDEGESEVLLLREVMGTARQGRVPFHYVADLVEGVRMDVRPRDYQTLAELRGYSYRVASVVGGWLTELFGVHDPWVLERAFALGHAMQLTNILRDVGEDLRGGRLYLPADHLRRFGLDRGLLESRDREAVPMLPAYRELLEELMAVADRDYEKAFQAIPALPSFFQRPVAVAARAYQGIHDEIRRNGYDNLTRRAGTTAIRKARLGLGALWSLAGLKRTHRRHGGDLRGRSPGVEDGREATA